MCKIIEFRRIGLYNNVFLVISIYYEDRSLIK